MAVYPQNNAAAVSALGKRLGVDLDELIYLKATDTFAKKQTPFPCACSYRVALTHYVDISSLPGHNILQEFVQYAGDDAEKQRLEHMVSKDGWPTPPWKVARCASRSCQTRAARRSSSRSCTSRCQGSSDVLLQRSARSAPTPST